MKLNKQMLLLSGLCALIASLLIGCASIANNPAKASMIASIAAYDVADVLLADKPQRLDAFKLALAQLRTLQARPAYDAAAVIQILRQIPAAALQTPRARIAFDAGQILIVTLGDPAVNPQGEQALRAVVGGFIDGLDRRLSQ